MTSLSTFVNLSPRPAPLGGATVSVPLTLPAYIPIYHTPLAYIPIYIIHLCLIYQYISYIWVLLYTPVPMLARSKRFVDYLSNDIKETRGSFTLLLCGLWFLCERYFPFFLFTNIKKRDNLLFSFYTCWLRSSFSLGLPWIQSNVSL